MVFQDLCGYRYSKRNLISRIIHHELFLPAAIVAGIGAIAFSSTNYNIKKTKYEVASPEIVHTERRDNKIIVNYAGRDYVLMHNNELNRPELFPTNRE